MQRLVTLLIFCCTNRDGEVDDPVNFVLFENDFIVTTRRRLSVLFHYPIQSFNKIGFIVFDSNSVFGY